jgi:CheY-like chemotaxis protein
MVLRKLFARSVRKVAPGWIVREASSGEAALLLTDSESFDLIFMDQYMASVERQLLGTETVSVLRAKGVACRICGLSANDMEDEFIKVGAHAFMFKPFPCESNALINELHRILEE